MDESFSLDILFGNEYIHEELCQLVRTGLVCGYECRYGCVGEEKTPIHTLTAAATATQFLNLVSIFITLFAYHLNPGH